MRTLSRWGSNGVISDKQGQKILCALYKERGNPTRQAIEDVVCKYEYYPGAKEAITTLRDGGYELAIVAGEMDLVAERIAKDLGVTRWASNNIFHFDSNNKLDRIKTAMNESEFKAVQLAKWCSELDCRSSEVALVADGANDLLAASLAGYVVEIGSGSVLDKRADVALGEAEYDKLPACFTK